jgi:hypothetical protein
MLVRGGNDPGITPRAWIVVERLKARVGDSPTFQEMDALRKMAGKAARLPDAAEAGLGGEITRQIDDFTKNSALITNGSVPAGAVNDLAKTARELARRKIISRDLNEMDRRSQWYVPGDESGMRNQIANYGRSPNGRRLTEEETRQFKKVVRREGPLNVAHMAGSRAGLLAGAPTAAVIGNFLLPGVGSVIAPPVAAAIQLGSRKAMSAYANKAIQNAKKTVLIGREGQKKLAKARKLPRVQAVQRTGLLGASAYPVQDSGRR